MAEEPSELELNAYVDGQLDTEGRFAVEDYLRTNPALAARVMGDLGQRSALQLLAHDPRPVPQALIALARSRNAGGQMRWRRWAPFGALSAAGALAVALLVVPGPPAYVGDAVTSHRVALLRAGMASQLEAPGFNAQEIRQATSIAVPDLPVGWKITDAQLFPTERGPALMMAVQTSEGDRLSIFAQHQKNRAPERPDAIREGAQSVAYWRRGDMSYALVGDSDPAAIDAKAETLARDWS